MDADKIKEFFIQHFEKMILVLVIAVSGYMMYSGWQLPNFLEKQQPTQLSTLATQVKSDIDKNHNEAILPERQPTFDIVKETIRVDTPVDPSDYSLPQTWSGKSPNSIVRRQDPKLLAPVSLIVKPVVTSFAVRGSRTDPEDYVLASLEAADAVERVEKPKTRRRRGRRGGDADMMEMMMGGGGEMDMEMGMSMDMDMDMGMMDMEMDGMDEGAGSAGGGRQLDSKYDFGMRPVATEDKRNPVPSVGWFIAGTAVVPHKSLHEAYKLAFQDADQYNARRDTPFYYDLEVQRADVTDKPLDQLVEEDWSKVWDRTKYTQLAAYRWSGFAPEIVPSDYRDDALTTWIPPVLLDDYQSFSLHPMIPMLSRKDLEEAAMSDEDDEEIKEFSMDMEDDSALVAPGQTAGQGSMMDMDYGMMDMEMDMEMGGMDGMMMGMGMAMMGGGGIETNPVDYKLIRFYDFAGFKGSPVFGRKYVYRIRYAVNDPNFPFSETLQPKVSSLSPEVAQRIQVKMSDARESQKRDFRRWSDWSEVTAPVSLPSLEQYFCGPVQHGSVNVWKVAGKDVEYTRDPPSAKFIASQYDLSTGARIPVQMDVTEGTVLSITAESADVVDPITLKVKKKPDVELISGTTVVDVDGGVPLKIVQGEELKTPGMMLLFDQMGQLRVSDEIGDQESYRIYSYADERGE